MAFMLPDLRYRYDALTPVLSAEAVETHHSKHHQAYVDKLNAALEEAPQLQDLNLVELLRNVGKAPETVRKTLHNNGGGHFNHSVMWDTLSPDAGEMSAEFRARLDRSFGSSDKFREKFEKTAVDVFGSGWACLVSTSGSGMLEIVPLANQDTPLPQGRNPLLLCDVWEHAYYIDYRNRRPEWVKSSWDIVDWPRVEARLQD